jgi:hypothetical protein
VATEGTTVGARASGRDREYAGDQTECRKAFHHSRFHVHVPSWDFKSADTNRRLRAARQRQDRSISHIAQLQKAVSDM